MSIYPTHKLSCIEETILIPAGHTVELPSGLRLTLREGTRCERCALSKRGCDGVKCLGVDRIDGRNVEFHLTTERRTS